MEDVNPLGALNVAPRIESWQTKTKRGIRFSHNIVSNRRGLGKACFAKEGEFSPGSKCLAQ